MTGRKLSKEKKRHRSRLGGPEEGGGGSERKRRSTEALRALSEETKGTPQVPEKEDVGEEPSDIEEGGLDLSVQLKPVSFYITDKKEMLRQCFYIIGEKKLQKMLPDVLKTDKNPGENEADSDSDEEEGDNKEKSAIESISQQDNSIDSTSSLKEDNRLEGMDSKQGRE
ncbi:hypothetical protein JD844_009407 [Phrynosoma platyrhinos]|uniref:Uncharacterized protein n=1 Tax=Phrynosoma platyrhinos TaxID=52577 RepID=A0ABQ7TGT0_PHRPL|nr:hypothetical protein JD844_009407 [Phrynosoma platyrhinos]